FPSLQSRWNKLPERGSVKRGVFPLLPYFFFFVVALLPFAFLRILSAVFTTPEEGGQ
ncbi:hypothetical protein AMECASPLE_018516, partial [Ameca splendens]